MEEGFMDRDEWSNLHFCTTSDQIFSILRESLTDGDVK